MIRLPIELVRYIVSGRIQSWRTGSGTLASDLGLMDPDLQAVKADKLAIVRASGK
jgi:hypothetical protein